MNTIKTFKTYQDDGERRSESAAVRRCNCTFAFADDELDRVSYTGARALRRYQRQLDVFETLVARVHAFELVRDQLHARCTRRPSQGHDRPVGNAD